MDLNKTSIIHPRKNFNVPKLNYTHVKNEWKKNEMLESIYNRMKINYSILNFSVVINVGHMGNFISIKIFIRNVPKASATAH